MLWFQFLFIIAVGGNVVLTRLMKWLVVLEQNEKCVFGTAFIVIGRRLRRRDWGGRPDGRIWRVRFS